MGRELSIIESSIWVATMTGLALRLASLMARFWTIGTCFQRHFDAEVAAGDHDAVEGVDDVVEVVDGLGLLDLGDDGEAAALLVHDAVDVVDVACRCGRRRGR